MFGPSRTNYRVIFQPWAQGHSNIMPENCLNSVQMDSMFLRRPKVLTVMLEDYEIAVFMAIPNPSVLKRSKNEVIFLGL